MKIDGLQGNIQTSGQNQIQVNSSANQTGLPQTLANLSQGQIFEGTITRDETGKLTIHLGNGESVSARMDGAVQLLENTATFFEVKSNQGGQLALRAVSQEASANPTLIKALQQANVAIDKENLQLVQEMMKQQLPIDAKSLGQMVRLAYAHKGVDATTLVQMTKLNLPVTENNIQQFQQYSNGQGNLTQALEHIMTRLPEAIEQGGDANGRAFFNQLQEIFLPEGVKSSLSDGTVPASGNGTLPGAGNETVSAAGEGTIPANGGSADANPTTVAANATTVAANATTVAANATAEGAHAAIEGSVNAAAMEQQGVSGQEMTGNAQPIENLLETLNGYGVNSGKSVTPKEFLAQLVRQMQGMTLENKDFKALFEHAGFKQLLRDVMEAEWFLRPEQVADKERITEVFEKMQQHFRKLGGLLEQMEQPQQSLSQSIKGAQGNVQFMNDLNHLYNYVQIPLKMANENAKGDLYVYTDKRALRQGKEELTAHLHLQLEHLGTTDVYVRLKEKKVATNFIMEKEESLDLVMKHIDVLTRRLQEKGYSVSAKGEMLTEQTKAPDFMQEIWGKELPSVAIQRYSLDVCV